MPPVEDIVGVPNEEQALSAVYGGEREYTGEAKDALAAKITESATAHMSWRQGLPFEQQLALADTPTITFPPAESESDSNGVHNAGV